MAKKQAEPVFPKSLGAAIDLLYTMRAQRLEEAKKLEVMQAQETALKAHIMANFASGDLDGAKGKVAVASIKRNTQAEVEDWEAYLKWAARKDPTCVQKRVGITALRTHWDNNEVVPGVKPVIVEELSLTKVGS